MPRAPKLVSDLVSDLKLRMYWDDATQPYTDAEIARVAQDILENEIWPAIAATRQDYLTTFVDVPLINPVAYDKTPGYLVPIDGLAKLVHVALVRRDNSEEPLEQYTAAEWERHGRYQYGGFDAGYYMSGGRIFLARHPRDPTGLYLRVYYVDRPLQMSTGVVLMPRLTGDPEYASGVVSIPVDQSVSAWIGAGEFNVDSLSFLSGAAPHLAVETLDVRGSVTATSSTTLLEIVVSGSEGPFWPTAQGANPSGAREGDFIVPNRRTPLVQLPVEGYRVLLNGVQAEFADARGDRDKYARKRDEFDRGLEGLPMKLVPRNGDGKVYVNWGSPGRTRRGNARWR